MPKPENYPPYAAHFDANQVPTIMGVVGSAGTADTGGTAQPLPVGVRADSGALYVYNLGPAGAVTVAGTDPTSYLPARLTDGTNFYNASGGAGGGTFVNISTGTQQTLGTVGVLNNGTLALVTAVTTVANLTNGTTRISLGSVGGLAASAAAASGNPVLIAGTDAGGTAYAPLVNSAGALSVTGASAGTFVNVSTGTQQTLGTVGVLNAGTLTALAVGTVGGKAASGAAAVANPVQIAGTDAGGTVYSPLISTAGILTTNLTSSGTLLNLATGTLAAVTTVTTLSNLTNGSVNILTGTLQSSGTTTGVGVVSNLTNGSVTMQVGTLTTGTLALATRVGNLGTLESGTTQINMVPVVAGTSFNTVGTTGAAVWGTLIAAAGAGTKQYVSGVDIVVVSGTMEVVVTNIGIGGSTGAGVLARGNFPAGGGISKNFNPVIPSNTNGTLAFWLGGAGTADITIQYWQGV